MVADLMPLSPYAGNHLRIAQCPLANQKESRFGFMLFQDFEYLRRELRVRTIIKRQRHQRQLGPHSIHDVRRQSLQHSKHTQRLDPKQDQPHHHDNRADEQEQHFARL